MWQSGIHSKQGEEIHYRHTMNTADLKNRQDWLSLYLKTCCSLKTSSLKDTIFIISKNKKRNNEIE